MSTLQETARALFQDSSLSIYIHSYTVMHEPETKTTFITYVPYAYDFINANLDFDELEYFEIIEKFDAEMENIVKGVILPGETTIITKGKMVFRNYHQVDSSKTIHY